MPGSNSFARISFRLLILSGFLLALDGPGLAQQIPITPSSQDPWSPENMEKLRTPQRVTITIGVRDARGLPIEDMATVHLSSKLRGVHQTGDTKSSADVTFAVLDGPYEVQVECPGYQTVKNELNVYGGSGFFTAYVYLHTEGDPNAGGRTAPGIAFNAKALAELDKGLEAMLKKK